MKDDAAVRAETGQSSGKVLVRGPQRFYGHHDAADNKLPFDTVHWRRLDHQAAGSDQYGTSSHDAFYVGEATSANDVTDALQLLVAPYMLSRGLPSSTTNSVAVHWACQTHEEAYLS